jgi:hypothetical protein
MFRGDSFTLEYSMELLWFWGASSNKTQFLLFWKSRKKMRWDNGSLLSLVALAQTVQPLLAASTTLSMITALLAFSLLRGPYYWHVG